MSRVSVKSDGSQADAHSSEPSISGDGRYVAFVSSATNLVDADTNACADIFVYDRQTGQTARVSVASDLAQADGASDAPSISGDGRYVAFQSSATNLVAGDTNGVEDIFVRDTQTGQTARVSVRSDASQSNGVSQYPSISADGRYVAFVSDATNLVDFDTNVKSDIFVYDRLTSLTTRVSLKSDGTQGNGNSTSPALAANGRYLTFSSEATNLVNGDTNAKSDIFLHDRQNGNTSRASLAFDGTQTNDNCFSPTISADGRYITFFSQATNLVAGDTNGSCDVFVRDRTSALTLRVSVAFDGSQSNGASDTHSISSDGRYVTFLSGATNLTAGDTNSVVDVFVRDLQALTTTRVSVSSGGTEANDASYGVSISTNGRYVTFSSMASNLVAGDTNSFTDIFVNDRGP